MVATSGTRHWFACGVFAPVAAIRLLPSRTSPRRGGVIRKLEIANGKVTTLAGKADALGNAYGFIAAARFAGTSSLATDGHALFITDPGRRVNDLGDPNGPTIRELELATHRVTTMIGTRPEAHVIWIRSRWMQT